MNGKLKVSDNFIKYVFNDFLIHSYRNGSDFNNELRVTEDSILYWNSLNKKEINLLNDRDVSSIAKTNISNLLLLYNTKVDKERFAPILDDTYSVEELHLMSNEFQKAAAIIIDNVNEIKRRLSWETPKEVVPRTSVFNFPLEVAGAPA